MAVSGLAAGAPSSSGDALAMALSGLRWLGQADLTSAPTSVLADGLRGLENAESLLIAARASVLSAFDRHRGFEGDGAGSARSWLRWRTKVSNGSASASMAWMRRLRTHRLVADALASARVSGSWARRICAWTDLLPAGRRDEADAILLQAVADGAELPDLAIIAEELHARLADSASTGDPRSRGSGGGSDRGPGLGSDRDPGSGPGCGSDDRAANRAADQRSGSGCDDDRGRGVDHGTGGSADNDGKLWLAVTFGGAGRLEADLSPGCAAALRAVRDSLGKKAGPEETRTVPQRQHDALYEALRRLIAVRNLPDRAGQPVQIQLHLSLEELLRRRGDSRPGTAWPSPAPGWPIAGAGEECDATIIPIVTGAIDYRLLDRLTRAVTSPLPGNAATQVRLNTDTVRDLIIANAAALLSGPRGLASWLRRRAAGRQVGF